jgi:hypothetical protein
MTMQDKKEEFNKDIEILKIIKLKIWNEKFCNSNENSS